MIRDNLDKASNIEIKQTAKQTLADLQEYVSQYDGKVNYEIKTVEGEGYPGPIIEEYILNNYPNLNLLITGTRNHQGLKK
jgi:nucleotide-binding universal stress UspA family protein